MSLIESRSRRCATGFLMRAVIDRASHLTLDIREYFVDQLGHIVGILRHILVTS